MVDVPQNFSMTPEQIMQMQQQSENPLQKYLRQPAIYLKLPSGGKYWPAGTLDMPVNGELPILPMSTKDEIVLNTPDALMNGQGVVDVIQSCVPNVKNAWTMPIMDVDAVLIAIRIASYGEKMEYRSTCTACQNQDEYEIDLREFLDLNIDASAYAQPFEYKGMQISLRPINYYTINLQNLDQFEQQRMITMLSNDTLSEEEKQARYYEIFKNMTRYTIKNISGSIEKIVTPDGQTVTDEQHIEEFLENSERQLFATMREKMEEVNKGIPEKAVTSTCSECNEQYKSPFTFDQANFFAFAS
jgi:hypothetical protein